LVPTFAVGSAKNSSISSYMFFALDIFYIYML
jgi:hypothetical protein